MNRPFAAAVKVRPFFIRSNLMNMFSWPAIKAFVVLFIFCSGLISCLLWTYSQATGHSLGMGQICVLVKK